MQDVEGNEPTLQIAGFWRRLLALAVDSTILGLFGIALGAVMFDELVRLGGYGRLLGFFVALVYSGTLNSWVGHGQTAGKWLLRVKVVGRDGSPLSLPRALARTVVFNVPFFLNGAVFSTAVLFSAWNYLISLLVFGGMASILYLYAFNRRTRQSLHDLAVGSYVVRADAAGRASFPSIWRGHLVVVAVMLVAALCVPLAAARLMQVPLLKDMLPAYGALSKLPNVQVAMINAVISKSASGETSEYVDAQLRLDKPKVDDRAFAENAARAILSSYPTAIDKDAIRVNLSYGYDIGIASNWRSHNYAFKPRELAIGDRDAKAP